MSSNVFFAILFFLLGIPFVIGGILKKPTQKFDLRFPFGAAPLPFLNLSFGLIVFSFGIFLLVYPLHHLLAYMVSIIVVLFALGIHIKRHIEYK